MQPALMGKEVMVGTTGRAVVAVGPNEFVKGSLLSMYFPQSMVSNISVNLALPPPDEGIAPPEVRQNWGASAYHLSAAESWTVLRAQDAQGPPLAQGPIERYNQDRWAEHMFTHCLAAVLVLSRNRARPLSFCIGPRQPHPKVPQGTAAA